MSGGAVDAALRADLQRRRAASLYRQRLVVEPLDGMRARVGDALLVNFSSNDYLGLAGHPQLVAALQRGAARCGVGGGAAQLVCGHRPAHQALEEELADFLQRPRALLFSTGYMANLGVLGALLGRGDALFQDRLNHASLFDGGRLAAARMRRYRHCDAAALERMLAAERRRVPNAAEARCIVATDGLFSMEGDCAPLALLAEVCSRHAAWLMVDDAHGVGVLGQEGRGTLAACGVGVEQVPILVGAFGKAFGLFGGFAAGGEALIETLIQRARPYLYTTAPPPALAEAARAALRLVRGAEGEARRARLRARIGRFRAGAGQLALSLLPSSSPIQPLLLGAAERAMAVAARLRARGFLVAPIRPPTVPAGRARLRIALSAAHSEAQVDGLLEALERSLAEIDRRQAEKGGS